MINEPCFRAPFLAVTGTGAIDFLIFAFAIGLRLFLSLYLFRVFPSNLEKTLSLSLSLSAL